MNEGAIGRLWLGDHRYWSGKATLHGRAESMLESRTVLFKAEAGEEEVLGC